MRGTTSTPPDNPDLDYMHARYLFRRSWWVLAALLTACGSSGSFCWSDLEPAPHELLSARASVRRAYRLLEQTDEFASAHVGSAGGPSCQVLAFQVIPKSKHAARGFAALVDQGTLAGQLYGLAGLYLADRPTFERLLPRYATMQELVRTQFGCLLGSYPVSAVVTSPASIDPSSLAEWHRENPLAEYPPVDIASGGWSLEFKNAYKR